MLAQTTPPFRSHAYIELTSLIIKKTKQLIDIIIVVVRSSVLSVNGVAIILCPE